MHHADTQHVPLSEIRSESVSHDAVPTEITDTAEKKYHPCPCSLFICLMHWVASLWTWDFVLGDRADRSAAMRWVTVGSLINWSLTPGEEHSRVGEVL